VPARRKFVIDNCFVRKPLRSRHAHERFEVLAQREQAVDIVCVDVHSVVATLIVAEVARQTALEIPQ
jgi:hypothetical protein